jgi:hypothetical protein
MWQVIRNLFLNHPYQWCSYTWTGFCCWKVYVFVHSVGALMKFGRGISDRFNHSPSYHESTHLLHHPALPFLLDLADHFETRRPTQGRLQASLWVTSDPWGLICIWFPYTSFLRNREKTKRNIGDKVVKRKTTGWLHDLFGERQECILNIGAHPLFSLCPTPWPYPHLLPLWE